MLSSGGLLPQSLDVARATNPPASDERRDHGRGRGGGVERAAGRLIVPLALSFLLALAFVAAAGGAIHLWSRNFQAGRQEDLRALAARRGWSLVVTGGKLGRAGTLRISSRGGHPWTTESRPAQGTVPQSTTYDAQEPRWTEGTLIVLAPPPDQQGVIGLVGDELSPLVAALDRFESPDGLVVLGDADPTRRVVLADIGRVLAGWTPTAGGGRGTPILLLSPQGMRLRLGHPIRRADQLERFIDLAIDLTRIIGP